MLQKIEKLFKGTLGTRRIDPVGLKLKENAKLIFCDHIQYQR